MADHSVKIDVTADLSKLDQSLAAAQQKAAQAGANMQRSLSVTAGGSGGGGALSFPSVGKTGGGVINAGSSSPINAGGMAMGGAGGFNPQPSSFHASGPLGGGGWNGGQAAFGNLRASVGGNGTPIPPAAVPPPFTTGQLAMMAWRGEPGGAAAFASRTFAPVAGGAMLATAAYGIMNATGGKTEAQRAASTDRMNQGVRDIPILGSVLGGISDVGNSIQRGLGRLTGWRALEAGGVTTGAQAAAEHEIQESTYRSAITRGMGEYSSGQWAIAAKSRAFQDEENAQRNDLDKETRDRIGAAHTAEIQADTARLNFDHSWDMQDIAAGSRGILDRIIGNSMGAGQEGINIQYNRAIASASAGGDKQKAALLTGQKGLASLANTIANAGYGEETDLRATALGPGSVHQGQANMSDPVIVQLLQEIANNVGKAGQ